MAGTRSRSPATRTTRCAWPPGRPAPAIASGAMMSLPTRVVAAVLFAFVAVAVQARADDLRSPADFASIANPAERARALFTEAGRVLQHPRCINCHPGG